jgi:NAD dependent epimerase/dehydratase family enzyme
MGEALLLGSQRVEPMRLREAGYQFQYPTLDAALRRALQA